SRFQSVLDFHEAHLVAVPLFVFFLCATIGFKVIVQHKETGRKIRFVRSLVLVSGFASGILSSSFILWRTVNHTEYLANHLMPLDYSCYYCSHWSWGGPPSSNSRFSFHEPMSTGLLLKSPAGEIVRVTANGKHETLRQTQFRVDTFIVQEILRGRWWVLPRAEG